MLVSMRRCTYSNLILFVSLVPWAQGTLTPDGQMWMDCGSKQTFTCNVSHIHSSAGWTITLDDIAITEDSGKEIANMHSGRISTSDSFGVTKSSTITITGFTTSDNGGIIQCIDLNNGSVQGLANISVGVPFCPSRVMSDFVSDCTRANVTWDQPPGGPPVTNATVTYCRESESSCSNSMTCTSPCTVLGLDPTEDELDSGIDYNFTVTPNNNCGSARGCTGNLHNPVRDVPECPERIDVVTPPGNECPKVFWYEDDGFASKAIIDYFPTGSSGIRRKRTPFREVCTANCTIPNLQPNTEYTFKATLFNNCGHAVNCNDTNQMNGTTGQSCNPPPTTTTTPPDPAAIAGGVVVGLVVVAAAYAIAVLIAVLCCSSCEGRSYCHVFFCQYCCGDEPKKPSSTRPMPADEYTDIDPEKVREMKEKEDKIQYANLEFSEQTGSSGEKPIYSKEEPVQYLSVEQA